MRVLSLIQRLSADECREMGQILIDFADHRHDPVWIAALEGAISRYEPRVEEGMAAQLSAARKLAHLSDPLTNE